MEGEKPASTILKKNLQGTIEPSATLAVASHEKAIIRFLLDALGNLIQINQAWEELLGFSQEESLGRPLSDFIVEARNSQPNGEIIKPDLFKPVKQYQLLIAGKNGVSRWFNSTVHLAKDETSGQLLAMTEHREIDTIKAELTAKKNKDQHLAFLFHELRNELHGVLGLSELLINTNLDENQRKYTQLMQKGSQQLLKTSNEVLDYLQLQAAEFKLDESDVDLASSFESIMEPFVYQCEQKGLEFRRKFGNFPASIVCDISRIRQIFTNLIHNAIKSTEQGYIEVGADCVPVSGDESQYELCCYVGDSGCGIVKEKQSNLFQAYNQVQEQGEGNGLGLAICERLVSLMGGEIKVHSEYRMGTRFFFTLRVGAKEVIY